MAQTRLPELPDSQTFTFFAANFVYVLLGCWLFAQVTRAVLFVASDRFVKMSEFHRRNVVTYVLEVPFETAQLVMAIGWGFKPMFDDATADDIKICVVNLLLLVCLYLFELIYRVQTRWPLLLHHLIAILLCILVVVFFEHTHDQRVIGIGVLVLLTAITEQLSFVALFCYRMSSRPGVVVWLLRVSAVQTVLFKIAFMVTAIVLASIMLFWSPRDPESWYKGYIPVAYICLPGLLATQIYAGWILWQIGQKRRHETSPDLTEESKATREGDTKSPGSGPTVGTAGDDAWQPTSVEATALHSVLLIADGLKRLSSRSLATPDGSRRASRSLSAKESSHNLDDTASIGTVVVKSASSSSLDGPSRDVAAIQRTRSAMLHHGELPRQHALQTVHPERETDDSPR